MQPAKDSFKIYQGSHLKRSYRWLRGNTQVSMNSASAKLQFRKSVKGDVIYEASSENGLISFVNNWVVCNFSAASTAALNIRDRMKLFGHLEVTLANGRTYRLAEISIIFEPEITR